MADIMDIKIAIAEKLAAAMTARDAAEEKVASWEQKVRSELERLGRHATQAAETEGELDPSPCLHYAEQVEAADRELSHAMNDRAAYRREVEMLEALLKVVKGE